jgi:chitodextrinase
MSGRRAVFAAVALTLGLLASLGAAEAGISRGSPTSPTNLRITASTATSVSLAWDASTSKSSNWWFCVQRSGSGCIRVDPPRTSLTLTQLIPRTTYSWSVVAVDQNGNRSAPSNTVSYTTPPDTAAPTAPVLSVGPVYPTRITVSWTASVDDTSQVSYTLLVDGSPGTADQVGYLQATILHLAPSSSHTFQVTVRDASGNASSSNVLSVTTPAATDATPPSAPPNLRLSPESSVPEIWLDWDPATDNSDPQSLLEYQVFLNGTFDHSEIGAVDSITYCRDGGPNTIAVRAVDTSGNASMFSNEIVFC